MDQVVQELITSKSWMKPVAFKGLLATARATAAETSDRIDALQGLILEGELNIYVLHLPELSAVAESFTAMHDDFA